MADGACPLGNDDRRCPAEILRERLAQSRIRLIIQRAGGIVQDQDLRMGRQCAGDQDTLFLPAAQVGTADRQPVSETVLQFFDKRAGLGALDRLVDLLLGDIPAKTDIFLHRVREQDVVLEHDPEFFMEFAERDPADVVAVDADRSLICIVKPDQKIDDRTLSASGRADDPERLALFQREGNICEHIGTSGMVCEGHVVKLDMILRILMISGSGLQIFRRVQHLADTFRGSRAFGEQHKHTVDRQHRVQNDRKVRQKRKDRTGLRLSAVDPERPGHDHQRQPRVQKKVHQRIAGSHRDIGFRLFLHDVPVRRFEPFLFIFRLGERFDHTDPGRILPDHAGHTVHRLLQLRVQRDALFRDIEDGHRDERQHRKKHQRQDRFHEHGHRDPAEQKDRRTDPEALHHSDHLMNVIRIGGQTGFQRSNGERVCLAAGKVRDPPEQIVPKAFGRIPGHSGRHPVGDHISGPGDHRADQHQEAVEKDLGHIFLRDDHIDQVRQNPRQEQIHDRPGELDRNPEDHPRNMRPQIIKYFLQRKTTPFSIN